MQQVWYKMYQNDIIFAITKAAFFSDTNGLGCHYQSYFKPISQDLISLICTGVRMPRLHCRYHLC